MSYSRHWMFRGSALGATVSQATSGEKSPHWKCPKNSINQLQATVSNFSDFCQTRKLNGKYEGHYILKVLRKSSMLFFLILLWLILPFKYYRKVICVYTKPRFLFNLEQESNGRASHVPVKCYHYKYSEKILNLLWSQVMNPKESHFLSDFVSTSFNFLPMRERQGERNT